MVKETERQRLEKKRAHLELERTSFEPHWRELGAFIRPRRQRLEILDSRKGDPRNHRIIDSTATHDLRTASSGMMSGITSPARPWFDLSADGVDMVEPGPATSWLYQVTKAMQEGFRRSNFYHIMPAMYEDLLTFGTAVVYREEDFDNILRFEIVPLGRYAISKNSRGVVDTLSRTFLMTTRQLEDKFGIENVSPAVKSLLEQGRTEEWVQVVHIVEPNKNHDPSKVEGEYKRFASFYYEISMHNQSPLQTHLPLTNDKFLRKSGYDTFPFYAVRWSTNGEDVYGTGCPGMDALGDIKQLQLGERKLLHAIEKMVDPPLIGPTALMNTSVSVLPSAINYMDVRDGQQGLRPVYEVALRVAEMEQKQEQVRQRIHRAFFVDLFLMLTQSDRREITATEVQERKEEKLWALGPVLEGLNKDLLDPVIDDMFSTMMKQGRLPEPPEELQGQTLKVEYVSVMARAMKMVDLGSMDTFLGAVVQIAQADPSALDKINIDQALDLYGHMTGVPAGVLYSDEEVATIREAKARQIQQQQQVQQMQSMASAAKDASQAELGGDNVLTQVLGG